MPRFLGEKGQNTIPYVNLFSLFPTTSFSGLIRIPVFDILQTPYGCSHICSGALQSLALPWLGPVCTSAFAREKDFLGLSMKSLPNTTHIFIWSRRPPRKTLFPTLPVLSKLFAQPPNALLIRLSHITVTSKFSLTTEIHVEVWSKNYRFTCSMSIYIFSQWTSLSLIKKLFKLINLYTILIQWISTICIEQVPIYIVFKKVHLCWHQNF